MIYTLLLENLYVPMRFDTDLDTTTSAQVIWSLSVMKLLPLYDVISNNTQL